MDQMYRVRAESSAMFDRRRYRPLEEVPADVYAGLSEAERALCEPCERPTPPLQLEQAPGYVAPVRRHVRIVPPEQNKTRRKTEDE